MTSREPRLLIVDDELKICTFLEKAVRPLGFQTMALQSPEKFAETLESYRPVVVIMDLMMPGFDGVELLRTMKDLGSNAHVIIISGMDHRMLSVAQNLGRSHGLNMLGILQKPISLLSLEQTLRGVIGVAKCFTGKDLERALANSELTIHFQPQISNETGVWTIDGAEALVRWNHPAFGILPPSDFLDVIEDNDMTAQLTDFVVEAGVRQLAEWIQLGLPQSLSINMSALFLKDLSFPDRLKRLMAHYAVPGSRLILELTESAAMADPTAAMDILLRLRMNGVRLSIDDFGTGYSSLKQLYQLPFDELKIDRTFIKNLPGDEEAETIVRATIGLAHALRLRVCAEGVETQAALTYLTELNCDRAQGYLISRAVPAEEFIALCGKWRSIKGRKASVTSL
jgi:EAL domain-containing protein (putative c-di-GMP-specific phosphodiesterase class I)